MDTSRIVTTSGSSETPTAKQVKTVSRGSASGKAQSGNRKPTKPGAPRAPVAKSDRKAESVTKDVPVTVNDIKPTAEEPKVPDSTTEISAPKVTEPKKKPTKADLAKAVYNEMVKQPNPSRKDIIARFKKEANLTTAGAQSYYYKFQQESGRVVDKGPTKMDKAREVFQALTQAGKARKEILSVMIKRGWSHQIRRANLLSDPQEESPKADRVRADTRLLRST
jgi:hypothetical protein